MDGDKIIVKIKLLLANILLVICPVVYDKYVQYKGGQKIIYVHMLKALYRMLLSLILYNKKIIKYIQVIGFEFNLKDMCVANQIEYDKQQTVTWHVDDLKSIHVDPKINDKFT